MSGTFSDHKVQMAYVGLKDEGNGAVLLLHLITPKQPGAENAAIQLWNTFFRETKKLPEPLFYKATGQELHVGYTIVDIIGRKIDMP